MHIAYKNNCPIDNNEKAYFGEEQAFDSTQKCHRSINDHINDDDVSDNISILTNDVSMNDVSPMDYIFKDTTPTNNELRNDDDVMMESYILRQLHFPENTSETKTDEAQTIQRVAPILIARVRTSLGLPKPKDCTVLLDSGASGSIVSKTIVKKLRLTEESKCIWNTAAGTMETNQKTKLQFMLPELSETRIIEWKMHVVDNTTMNYDIIIGRDILEELGIVIDFKTKQITWDEVSVPMRSMNTIQQDG